MTHDPLCVWAQDAPTSANCYVIEGSEPPMTTCEVIAKVRADTIKKCVTAVVVLFPAYHPQGLDRNCVLNALRSVQAPS